VFEASVNSKRNLQRVQIYIAKMPSFSKTVTKVLEICNDPNTSPNDLNRVISLDPVLAGQVMKVINSAYYSLPSKITSLTRAIIMLGLNTVKNLALSTAVLKGLGGRDSSQALSMDSFWFHSIGVGVTAKSLAAIKRIPVMEREEYFLGGLLHDLGKIPLNDHFPKEYLHACEQVKHEQDPLYRAENAVFGFDHCGVGKMIAEKWQLADAINDLLTNHHSIEDAKEENRQFISIVALANIYANVFEIGSSGDPFPEEDVLTYLLEQVGIDWYELSDLRESVFKDIEKAKVFLQATKRG
jgi:HD-like signal output (HDOD) protein